MTPEEIKSYFLHAPGGKSPGNIVCKALVVKKDKYDRFPSQVCHAFLNRIGKGATQLYSSLWYDGDTRDMAKEFWDYVLDPNKSPWRSVLKGVEYVLDDTGYPIAFKVDIDADTSSQVMVNLCIATRIPYENKCNLRLWSFLRSKGYDEHEAFLVSCYVKLHGNHIRIRLDNGHFPILAFESFPKLSDLRNGTPPKVDKRKLQKGDDYYPSHAIWGTEAVREHGVFKALSKSVPYTGVFQDRFKHIKNYNGMPEENGVISNITEALAALEATRHTW